MTTNDRIDPKHPRRPRYQIVVTLIDHDDRSHDQSRASRGLDWTEAEELMTACMAPIDKEETR